MLPPNLRYITKLHHGFIEVLDRSNYLLLIIQHCSDFSTKFFCHGINFWFHNVLNNLI